jgi:hypothetical protein
MKITITLPDDLLFQSALHYQTLDGGYRTVEDCCSDDIVSSIWSNERFGSKLSKICSEWSERYKQKEEAAA